MIAALFVKIDGVYSKIPNIDLWDIERDAKTYDGNYPIVGHPPCNLWCKLAYSIQGNTRFKVGQDGGMFKSCLENVRKYGGVLEHPAGSIAWKTFGLRLPPKKGGWIMADNEGGYTCHVEQYWYGHLALKPTWLYIKNTIRPELEWNMLHLDCDRKPIGLIDHPSKANRIKNVIKSDKIYLSGYEASRTPYLFRDTLVNIARSAYGTQCNECNVYDERKGNHHKMNCSYWTPSF